MVIIVVGGWRLQGPSSAGKGGRLVWEVVGGRRGPKQG